MAAIIKEKLYRQSILLIVVITVIFVVLTVADRFHSNKPLVVALLALYCIMQLLCLFTHKLNVKSIGFFFLHGGIVLFLVGNFIYLLIGTTVNISIPVDNTPYSTIVNKDAKYIDLGFNISVNDFNVIKYEPVYDLYVFDNRSGDTGKWKLTAEGITPDKNGVLRFGKYGSLEEKEFINKAENNTQYQLSDDKIIIRRQPDKHYEASMTISDLDGSNVENKELLVNKPLRKKGWIVYLLNYSRDMTAINVLFKYDPVEYISTAGLWLIIIGTFMLCFRSSQKAVNG